MKKYLKFKELCEYLSVPKSFIRKRINISLFENEHFFRLPNSRLIRFEKEAIDRWVKNHSEDMTAKDILDLLK